MAPIACTPPVLNILLTPATLAATNMAGFTFPLRSGGVHNTISLQPAILAGVASMRTVENNGAVPPGIYRPTFSMGTLFCQQVTPGAVSTFTPLNCCALWKELMLAWASSIASRSSSGTMVHASSISSSLTARLLSCTWSNFSSYLLTAASPLAFMSARMLLTVALSVEVSSCGRSVMLVQSFLLGYLIIFIGVLF